MLLSSLHDTRPPSRYLLPFSHNLHGLIIVQVERRDDSNPTALFLLPVPIGPQWVDFLIDGGIEGAQGRQIRLFRVGKGVVGVEDGQVVQVYRSTGLVFRASFFRRWALRKLGKY